MKEEKFTINKTQIGSCYVAKEHGKYADQGYKWRGWTHYFKGDWVCDAGREKFVVSKNRQHEYQITSGVKDGWIHLSNTNTSKDDTL